MAAQNTEHPYFTCRFIARTRHVTVHPFFHINAQLAGTLFCQLTDFLVVRVGHIVKAGAKRIDVVAAQRAVGNHLDMIFDQHELSGLILGIEAACCIGHYQAFNSQHFHAANGKNNLIHRQPFVIVQAPLEHHHRHLLQHPYYQSTGVSFHRRTLKMRDVIVRDDHRIFHLFGQSTKTRAKHYSQARR